MTKISLIGAVLVLMAVNLNSLVHASDSVAIAQNLREATVEVSTLPDSKGVVLGTAFYVTPNLLVTSEHIVRGRTVVTLKRIGDRVSTWEARVLLTDPTVDLALLRSPNESKSPLSEFSSVSPLIGSRIFVIGNPNGLLGTFSDGVVSNLIHQNQERIQFSAPVSPGSSGGPVVDSDGRLVGVVQATMRSGQNLNFAVPVRYLSRLLLKANYDLTDLGFTRQQIAQLLGNCDLWVEKLPPSMRLLGKGEAAEFRKEVGKSGLIGVLGNENTRVYVAEGPKVLALGAEPLDATGFRSGTKAEVFGKIQAHALGIWTRVGVKADSLLGILRVRDANSFPEIAVNTRAGDENLYISFRYLLPYCFYWSVESVPLRLSHQSNQKPYFSDLQYLDAMSSGRARLPKTDDGQQWWRYTLLGLQCVVAVGAGYWLWSRKALVGSEVASRMMKYNLVLALLTTLILAGFSGIAQLLPNPDEMPMMGLVFGGQMVVVGIVSAAMSLLFYLMRSSIGPFSWMVFHVLGLVVVFVPGSIGQMLLGTMSEGAILGSVINSTVKIYLVGFIVLHVTRFAIPRWVLLVYKGNPRTIEISGQRTRRMWPILVALPVLYAIMMAFAASNIIAVKPTQIAFSGVFALAIFSIFYIRKNAGFPVLLLVTVVLFNLGLPDVAVYSSLVSLTWAVLMIGILRFVFGRMQAAIGPAGATSFAQHH